MLRNAEGRPEGKADEYWFRAKEIIEHQDKLADEEAKRGDM